MSSLSTSFGGKRPIRPQYGVEKGGWVGELADLRNDIDEAFQTLETMSAASFPTIHMLDAEQPLDISGADLVIRGGKLLNGGVVASLNKNSTHGLTFYACTPGTAGNSLTVRLIAGAGTIVAYAGGALQVTFNNGVDNDNAIATAINAASSAARGYVRCVSSGTKNAAAIQAAGGFLATAMTGGLGTDWSCLVSGAAALPVQATGAAPTAPVADAVCAVRIPDLTALSPARTSADENTVFVVANGVRSNPAFLRSTTRSLSTLIHVDVGYGGSDADGTPEKPYATIQEGIDAASAGDLVFVGPGAYAESLTLKHGVNLKSILRGTVTVTGSVTSTNVSCTIQGVNFIDDTLGGDTFAAIGVAVRTIRLIDCNIIATGTGGLSLSYGNANGILELIETDVLTRTGNANEAAQIRSGTFRGYRSGITHEDTTSEAIVFEGQAATTALLRRCDIRGQVGHEAALVVPTLTIEHCSVDVGAVAAVLVAAGCTLNIFDCQVTSAEATNLCFDGAGTVQYGDLTFRGTAYGFAGTLTAIGLEESATLPENGIYYVDIENVSGIETGSRRHPLVSLADANAVAVANDVIYVRAGTYSEHLVAVDGVTYVAEGWGRGYSVLIDGAVAGTLTCDDVNANFEGFLFQDDGVTGNDAALVTQTAAAACTVQFQGCRFTGTAAGASALHVDSTNVVVVLNDCVLSENAGNVSEACRIETGTVNGYDCVIQHGTLTRESLVAEGAAATTTNWFNTYFTGRVVSEAAVVNPTMRLIDCEIDVGAVSGLAIAAGNTVRLLDVKIDSTQADGYAISGLGRVELTGGCVFSDTAQDFDPNLTVVELATARIATRTFSDPGSVCVFQIVATGLPAGGQLLTIGADTYEANGAGGNINFAIGGTAEATMDNLLAAAVANGTENFFWDKPGGLGTSILRLRSADGPQGNIIAADPNVAVTENLNNTVFDCGNVNVNTLAGRAAGVRQEASAVLTLNAGHIAATTARISFPFAVARFEVSCRTALGADISAHTDTFLINNGDVLVTLAGGVGDLVATDVVCVKAYSA